MNKFKKGIQIMLAATILGLCGCIEEKEKSVDHHIGSADSAIQMISYNSNLIENRKANHPIATYEVFLYSFYDSNGDGIGDIQGLIQKLDYIKELGFQQIWLMPISPSPTYHKYDVTDYMNIDEQYGTLEDFDLLVKEAKQRNMQIIIDLVLNHTSSMHPWFQEAKNALEIHFDKTIDEIENPYIKYYNFSNHSKYGYTSLPDGKYYYEARFSSKMPDLNLDNPKVLEEIEKITAFWLSHGIAGFRLDACAYYYLGEHEKNIYFLSWLKKTIQKQNPNAYLVGETWETMEIYQKYYQSGIDSFFDFAFSQQDGVICRTIKQDITPDAFVKTLINQQKILYDINPYAVNAPFYTNHDTARSVGYYAGDDGKKTKLALALNLLMNGNSFLYYGEELGMKGSGKDENKRAPMQWSNDINAKGMCRGPKDMGKVKMKFPSYEMQVTDETSIYSYVKQVMRIRNAYPEIADGIIEYNNLTNDCVAVLTKTIGDESIMLVINFSESKQVLDISHSAYQNLVAVLNLDEQKVICSEKKLEIPAGNIAILKK